MIDINAQIDKILKTKLPNLYWNLESIVINFEKLRVKQIKRYAVPDDYLAIVRGYEDDPVLRDLILYYWNEVYTVPGTALILQCLDEIAFLHKELGDTFLNNFVEIGSMSGGSLWIYTKLFCKPGSRIICIDPILRKDLIKVLDILEHNRYNVSYIQKFAEECIDEVSRIVGPSGIECLHLDGYHTIVDCLQQWNLFVPLIAKNGILIIHDTFLWQGPIFLRKYVEKNKLRHKTFVGKLLIGQIPQDTVGTTIVYSDGKKLPQIGKSIRWYIFYWIEKFVIRPLRKISYRRRI